MRRIRGGLDIIPVKDSEFKYTIDPRRILWTKNVYPISQYLLQMIQSIPWNDYRFEGETTLWTERIVNSNNNSNGFTMTATESIIPVDSHRIRISASTESITPYSYFGGCVYEILNTRYKPMTNLRSFVDPTGDIDVALCLPKITHTTEQNYLDYHFKNLKTGNNVSGLEMTELVDNYTRWVFNEVVKKISASNTLLGKLFENTVEFEYSEAQEGVVDISKKIGNLWVVRSVDLPGNMIKIQLICKFKDMEVAEHLIEFVLHLETIPVIESLNHSIEQMTKESFMFSSFPIMNFSELLKGNIQTSLENRIKFWDTPIRHKFYNHVGRVQYLNDLLPRLIKKPDDTVANSVGKIDIGSTYYTLMSQILSLCKLLIDVRRRGEICKYDYKYTGGECNQLEIIDKLFEGLSTMLFKQRTSGAKIPYISISIRVKNIGSLTPAAAVETLFKPSLAGGSRRRQKRHHTYKAKRRIHRTKKRA
jgi:hypothetical protein